MAGGFRLTTTASKMPVYLHRLNIAEDVVQPNVVQSRPLINLDAFRADPRFAGINGSGFSSVIIDSGIDLNHPFFGPDSNSDGIADRIVFQYDFSGSNDNDASDFEGHGSNVASIVAAGCHPTDGTGDGIIAEGVSRFATGHSRSGRSVAVGRGECHRL
jgi:subtilisin family serine protease